MEVIVVVTVVVMEQRLLLTVVGVRSSNLRVHRKVQSCPNCNSTSPFLAELGPNLGRYRAATWMGPNRGCIVLPAQCFLNTKNCAKIKQ